MDIRTITTFVRAVELGSFTKTAEELNYVQMRTAVRWSPAQVGKS